MASTVPMARSRGSLSGLALVLLGAWGGLALLIGPYFGFGFEPDKPWVYTSDRLYLSILPGAVTILAGLIVLVTKTRGVGGTAAVVAALAGAWFAVGQVSMAVLAGDTTTYSPGTPIGTSLARTTLDNVASYVGVGLLIVFFAALALGRFSIAAHKDHARYADLEAAGLAGGPNGGLDDVGLTPSSSPYDPYQPTQASPQPPPPPPTAVVGGETRFPSQYPAERFPTGQSPSPQSATTTAQSPAQSPPWEPAPPAAAHGSTAYADIPASGFTPGQVTYSAGQTRYPPAQEQQTASMTAPTEEQ